MAYPRGLLTRGAEDIGIRIRGGALVIMTMAASPQSADEADPVSFEDRLAQLSEQIETATSLTIPSPAVIPVGDMRVEALTIRMDGLGAALIDGQGGAGRDYEFRVDALAPYGLTGQVQWAQDASLTVDLATTAVDDAAGADQHPGGVAFGQADMQLAIPQGRMHAGEGQVRVEALAIPLNLLPSALVPLFRDGISANATMAPETGIKAAVAFGGRGDLAVSIPWPVLALGEVADSLAPASSRRLPVTVSARALTVGDWVFTSSEQQLVLQCCAGGALTVEASDVDVLARSTAQPVAFRVTGPLAADYRYQHGVLNATAELRIAGIDGQVDGMNLAGNLVASGTPAALDITATAKLLRWPEPMFAKGGPVVDVTLTGRLAGEEATGRVTLDMPDLDGFPAIPLDYQAQLNRTEFSVSLPETRFDLVRSWLEPANKLAPPWLYESLTALNGHATFGADLRLTPSVSGHIKMIADISRATLFGTDITGFTFRDELKITGNELAESPDLGRLSIAQWSMGEGLALTDLNTSWRWRDGSRLHIEPMTAALLGGRIQIDGVVTTIPVRDLSTRLTVQNLSLQQFAQTLEIPGLNAEGRINGDVGVLGEAGQWRLVNGQFMAQDGRLQYRGVVANAAVAEQANLAFDVLENFEYDSLTMSLDGVIGGNQSAKLRLVGRNPAVYDGYPVDLNINLSGALDAIAQRSLDALAIPDRIARELAPQ